MTGFVRKRYIALIALGILLLLAVTFLFQAMTIYPTQAIAKETGSPVGIAPFTDRIDFGDIPQGTSVSKTLVLENQGAVPNRIIIFVIGGIGNLVKVEPGSLTLKEGETKEVKFRLTMPASATPERKYSGRVFVLRFPQRLF